MYLRIFIYIHIYIYVYIYIYAYIYILIYPGTSENEKVDEQKTDLKNDNNLKNEKIEKNGKKPSFDYYNILSYKKQMIFDENVVDVLELLEILEICLMHGIKVSICI
jgi:hypothetical protein